MKSFKQRVITGPGFDGDLPTKTASAADDALIDALIDALSFIYFTTKSEYPVPVSLWNGSNGSWSMQLSLICFPNEVRISVSGDSK